MGRAVLLAAALATGCLDAPPISTTGDPPVPACSKFAEWGDPIPVPGLESVPGASPSVDADATLLVWETSGPDNELEAALGDGESFEIHDDLVADLNTVDPERNPTLSDDGLTIWFTRGTQDATVLFASHRIAAGDPFPPAIEVEGLVVGPEGPDIWDAEHELYFSVLNADFDLARASCEDVRTCTYLGILTELLQDLDDVYPTIRSDGLELIYYSASADGLLSATRSSMTDEFLPGEKLPLAGYDPELTGDARTLYLAIDELLYRASRDCSE